MMHEAQEWENYGNAQTALKYHVCHVHKIYVTKDDGINRDSGRVNLCKNVVYYRVC